METVVLVTVSLRLPAITWLSPPCSVVIPVMTVPAYLPIKSVHSSELMAPNSSAASFWSRVISSEGSPVSSPDPNPDSNSDFMPEKILFRSTEAGTFFRSGQLKYSLPLSASYFACTSHTAVPLSVIVSFASAVPAPPPATTPSTPADFSQLTSVPSEDIRERSPSPNSIVPENFQASFAASSTSPASSCPA